MNEPIGHVLLDGVAVPLVAGSLPSRSSITQFPSKIQIGPDPRLGDSTLVTVFSIASPQGGLGRRRYRQNEEGVARVWYENGMDSRSSVGICMAPKKYGLAVPAAVAAAALPTTNDPAIGFFVPANKGGEILPIFFSGDYHVVPVGNLAADGTGSFSHASTAAYRDSTLHGSAYATSWGDYLFMTQGTRIVPGDYSWVVDAGGAMTANATATSTLECMVGIEDEMFAFKRAVTALGGAEAAVDVYSNTAPGGAAPTAWTPQYRVYLRSPSEFMVGAIAGTSGDAQPAIYLLTNRHIYQLDPSSGRLTELYRFSKSQTQSNLSSNFGGPFMLEWERTRAIYVALGQFIFEIGGAVRPVGPFGDDGLPNKAVGSLNAHLPYGLSSPIGGLFASQHNLFCVLRGDGTTGANANLPCLLAWDTVGWHTVATGNPGDLWGQGIALNDNVFVRQKPVSGSNVFVALYDADVSQPSWQRGLTERQFEQSGITVFPSIDLDQPAVTKLAVRLDVLAQQVIDSGATIQIQYQVDTPSATWTTLGTVTTDGVTTLSFGGPGVAWKTLYLRANVTTTNPAYTPFIELIALKLVPRPAVKFGWTLTANLAGHLDGEGGYQRQTPKQLKQFLLGLQAQSTMVHVQFNDVDTYCFVSGLGGLELLDDTAEGDENRPPAVFTLVLLEP